MEVQFISAFITITLNCSIFISMKLRFLKSLLKQKSGNRRAISLDVARYNSS